MKVKVEMYFETEDPKAVEELKEVVNSIKSGALQRDMRKDWNVRVKAVVDVNY
jgi:hypothetical protein